MIQLFDSVYLLDGTVGKRPLYLPLLVGEWGCLLLDTGCSYHVNDLILPAFDQLQLRPEQLRYIINTPTHFSQQGTMPIDLMVCFILRKLKTAF